MALFILLSQDGGRSFNQEEWHVGQANPVKLLDFDTHAVKEVQADGDELLYLWNRFSFVREGRSIDTRTKGTTSWTAMPRVIRYFGDDAKFIVGNLT